MALCRAMQVAAGGRGEGLSPPVVIKSDMDVSYLELQSCICIPAYLAGCDSVEPSRGGQ